MKYLKEESISMLYGYKVPDVLRLPFDGCKVLILHSTAVASVARE